jgi:hypothetical protein
MFVHDFLNWIEVCTHKIESSFKISQVLITSHTSSKLKVGHMNQKQVAHGHTKVRKGVHINENITSWGQSP